MAEKNNTKESSQRGENSVLFSLSSLTAVGNNNQAQTPVNNQPASKPAHQPGVTSSDKSGPHRPQNPHRPRRRQRGSQTRCWRRTTRRQRRTRRPRHLRQHPPL